MEGWGGLSGDSDANAHQPTGSGEGPIASPSSTTLNLDLAAVVGVAERCGQYETIIWQLSDAFKRTGGDPWAFVNEAKTIIRSGLGRTDWGM